MSGDKILSVEHLMMHFGGIKALNDVNLDVERGSITALIGPNGAGKTTVFNCLTGFYKATGGNILLNTQGGTTDVIKVLGQPFQGGDFVNPAQFGNRLYYKMFGGTHLVNRAGLARTFQRETSFDKLTVFENAMIGATYGGRQATPKAQRENAAEALDVVGIAQKDFGRLAEELSVFDRKCLMLATAVAMGPRILLLDEPASGLTKPEIETSIGLIRKIAARGITIVLIEHVLTFLMTLSQHLLVLNQGQMLAMGDPKTVISDPRVVEAYLGTRKPDL